MTTANSQLGPLTPMGQLPSDVAYQSTIAAYVMVGTAGALIWDVLLHIRSAYQLLFKHRITAPTITYFLARTSTVSYVVANIVFQTAARPDCAVLRKLLCVLYHTSFSATSFLFFLRTRAVFRQNTFVVAFFFILWLVVSVASLVTAIVSDAVHFVPTQDCRASAAMPYSSVSAAPVAYAVNDTLVFLAISWRLLKNAGHDPDRKRSLKSMVLGRHLPSNSFTKFMLRDSQVYYLFAVTSNLVAAVISWIDSVPVAYHVMLAVMNVALTNMMACRVYRHTKFYASEEPAVSTRWIASQLGHCDIADAVGRHGSIRFAASCQQAPSVIPNTSPQQASSPQNTHVTQKMSPAGDVEAGDVHRTEKVDLTQSDDGSAT
ncbi:hypothetical protein LshimejAT787_1102170 [Lyophyllum shimeji]|uniref:Uncharacterized protein n=1 Tax=Lyophyllum shimeji TaxID=47721 RepID=A0A9P3PSX5_LYOSH|nr:hypothetical protein LshimejAT787_1102170 [Lyophyllum shimeji]